MVALGSDGNGSRDYGVLVSGGFSRCVSLAREPCHRAASSKEHRVRAGRRHGVAGSKDEGPTQHTPNTMVDETSLQSRFNRAQVPDKQETNRVVRLAYTDLALLVCRIPENQICCVSYGDVSGGGTRAEQAQAGYVIMFVDMSLLAGLAAPVTRVSWISHRVKRVVASASAAEATGLSEAIAQGDWVRAL